MPIYEVGVARYYLVNIEAENEEAAQQLSAFFLGDCPDSSNAADWEKYHFKIHKIKMVENDPFMADEVEPAGE